LPQLPGRIALKDSEHFRRRRPGEPSSAAGRKQMLYSRACEINTVDGLMTIAERGSSWRLTRMDSATHGVRPRTKQPGDIRDDVDDKGSQITWRNMVTRSRNAEISRD
jgi:hypothetical protein